MLREPRQTLTRQDSEALAIRGLQFLAADPTIVARFLALSGLEAGHLRAAAASPEFLGGVLEYFSGDEALLQAFAASAGVDPARVGQAAAMLAGPIGDG